MMTSTSIHNHQLPSTIDSLAKVELIVEELKEAYTIPEELYGNILVSLSEAANNAIKHGNKLNPNETFHLSFDQSQSEYIFTVVDKGEGFDFENIPDPTHPDNLEKPDGRGIFIMRNLADEVEFNNKGKEVRIKFKRA